VEKEKQKKPKPTSEKRDHFGKPLIKVVPIHVRKGSKRDHGEASQERILL